MLWFGVKHRTIGQLKKNAHGDHIFPFAKMKKRKVQKTGMVTDRRNSRGPTIPKTHNTPKPMMFPTDFPSKSNWRRNE